MDKNQYKKIFNQHFAHTEEGKKQLTDFKNRDDLVEYLVRSYEGIPEFIASKVQNPSFTTIVDIGCATALQSWGFTELGFRYIGIDYSDDAGIFQHPDAIVVNQNIEMLMTDIDCYPILTNGDMFAVIAHFPAAYADGIGYQPNLMNRIYRIYPRHITF